MIRSQPGPAQAVGQAALQLTSDHRDSRAGQPAAWRRPSEKWLATMSRRVTATSSSGKIDGEREVRDQRGEIRRPGCQLNFFARCYRDSQPRPALLRPVNAADQALGSGRRALVGVAFSCAGLMTACMYPVTRPLLLQCAPRPLLLVVTGSRSCCPPRPCGELEILGACLVPGAAAQLRVHGVAALAMPPAPPVPRPGPASGRPIA